MDLKEYLFRNNLTCAEMGRSLNYSPNYMVSIKNHVTRPSKKLAKQIEIYTGGQVTIDDLRGEHVKYG